MRLLVLLLLLANGLYFGWTLGLLRELGLGPAVQTEPQRLEQQLKPQALRILTAEEARRVEALAAYKPPPPECLEAGLFDARQGAVLRQTLEERLPVGSWTLQAAVRPGRWIVYMGKFASTEALGKKKAEIKARGIAIEALRNPALEPGLSLGGSESQALASQTLKDLVRQGVRSARVVQEKAEQRGEMLRLPEVDDKLRPRIDDIREALGAVALRSCAK